jgi:hypothetical protein
MRRSFRLLISLMLTAVAGCGGPSMPATSSPAPSDKTTSGPSLEATPTASAVARATASPRPTYSLALESIAAVVEGPLRVRSNPRVADDSVKMEPLLATGTKVFVLDGPVRTSDYDWYRVNPMTPFWGPDVGWVAAADHDGSPWLAPTDVDCLPMTSDVLANLPSAALRLYCYGSGTFRFQGVLTPPEPLCEGQAISPDWLADCAKYDLWMSDGGFLQGVAQVGIAPGLSAPTEFPGRVVNVVGHFDDTAARTCLSPGGNGRKSDLEAASLILFCRETLVASAVEDLGPWVEP